jgi:uncharacterized protein (TIGR02444 family)
LTVTASHPTSDVGGNDVDCVAKRSEPRQLEASSRALDWPDNPLWDHALTLYRQPGVEAACLELQRRHGLDVNMVLFCCWLGQEGIDLDAPLLAAARAATSGWQSEVVRPLRALRNRLKAKLIEPDAGSVVEVWPELAGRLRQRALALELEGERLSQLALHRIAEGRSGESAPGPDLAWRNLRCYWPFDVRDHHALKILLGAAFAETSAADLSDFLASAEDR